MREFWLDICTPFGDPCDFISEGKPCSLVSATNIHVIEKSPDNFKIGEHTVFCDSEDYAFLIRFNWTIQPDKKNFYARTNVNIGGKQTTVSMHRLVCSLVNSEIDHKNRNGLDNRKENLRFCTSKQNQCNRHRKNKFGFRGVYKAANEKHYSYQIQIDGKKYHERGFKTAEEAAKAYDLKSKELHGEFGIRNFKD